MVSKKTCCVPTCKVSRSNSVTPLHTFPNPETDAEKFRSWIYAIGGEILALESQYIYKNRRVCHRHFEEKYHTWTKTLSPAAIPTLNLPGTSVPSNIPLTDLTSTIGSNQNVQLGQPSTSKGPFVPSNILNDITSSIISNQNVQLNQPSTSKDLLELHEVDPTNVIEAVSAKTATTTKTLKTTTVIKKNALTTVKKMEKVINKLVKQKDSYASRLKKALKLSENKTFQRYLNKFSTLAAMFTLMQFREIPKDKMGRRFTKEEKIMSLSLYKQGPKAYRWLSKFFILPSPVTLSRLISQANIMPGINKKLFMLLKNKAQVMSDNDKLCVLLFDEIAISPNFYYNQRKDVICGFVTYGKEYKRQVADHALVFMLRGIIRNYKQPISYTFCSGSTPRIELKCLIKTLIIQLQTCGFKVLATVCDQGTTNVSAINNLIQETREENIKNNKVLKGTHTFQINGEEIIPIYDPPHLIKGVRNNLITKNLKFTIDNTTKVAKWEHIIKLHEENPGYKGIKLVKNLTELHVNPKKICKMKVKYATQVFSQTVASNIGYLADKGVLSEDCKDTADVLLFFDELFDSMNGSYLNSKNRTGKPLLGPVTPKSEHSIVWNKSKMVLQSMRFITKEGREGNVPSITNWIHTINNAELLKNKLFNKFHMKSFWMRHLNQDPLENFFGCIRSHGYRNVSPTPSGFEAAFTSLLINNMSSNHSPGSNCEEDHCKKFQSMDSLLTNTESEVENIEIDFEDFDCEIVDYNEKKNNPRIFANLNYVTGYILRKAKSNVFKNCKQCKKTLYDENNSNHYLKIREYRQTKQSLTYPSEHIVKMFSHIQDIISNILEKKSNKSQIKLYLKTILFTNVNFNFIDCPEHQRKLVDFIFDLCSRFFINSWCCDVNKLLKGNITKYNGNDKIKESAHNYYTKRNKKTKS